MLINIKQRKQKSVKNGEKTQIQTKPCNDVLDRKNHSNLSIFNFLLDSVKPVGGSAGLTRSQGHTSRSPNYVARSYLCEDTEKKNTNSSCVGQTSANSFEVFDAAIKPKYARNDQKGLVGLVSNKEQPNDERGSDVQL